MKPGFSLLSRNSTGRLALFLFLVLWFTYGTLINSANLLDFDLQQIGAEAMVERGHFYLEHSLPGHRQTKGDVFSYRGHNYAAKQPGQFMAGAIVYWLLHKLGLSYLDHYLLTAALVTFFTTSLVMAAGSVALFAIARELSAEGHGPAQPAGAPVVKSRRLFWPLAAALSYALGTTAFAYSGIAQHDALAASYLVLSFWLMLQLAKENTGHRISFLRALGAGLLLGLTISTSMLPFFMALTFLLYFLYVRRWSLLPIFLLGLLGGLLPLFVYDAVSFGNPFLLPNVAGADVFSDTFFFFDPNNFGDKLVLYARSLMLYVPVFALGLLGLSYYPSKGEARFVAVVCALLGLFLFVLNISSDGDCQFGPRYLLPAMPFVCLGIAGFSYLSTTMERRIAAVALGLVGLVSFAVNLVGALRGAMNCPHGSNALGNQLLALRYGPNLSYPLATWLLLPLLICLLLLVQQFARARTQ
jgi:hypothetical protein